MDTVPEPSGTIDHRPDELRSLSRALIASAPALSSRPAAAAAASRWSVTFAIADTTTIASSPRSRRPRTIAAVRSMDPDLVLKNIVSTEKTAKAFGLPIVHSTINVASGRGKPTVPELAELALACELQRDWARLEAVEAVVQIVLTERLLKE